MWMVQCEINSLSHSKFIFPVAIEYATNAIRNAVKTTMRAFITIELGSRMIEYLRCCLLVLAALRVVASCATVSRYDLR